MIPFPYLLNGYYCKYKCFGVLIKQVNELSGYRGGYYRVENNILIGKNGQISVEEFMKEIARVWKSKEIDSEHRTKYNAGIFRLMLRDSTVIAVCKDYACSFSFFQLSIIGFLNKEDFLRTTLCLLFDNEQYVGIEYIYT